jgi:hypothetical protein
MRSTGAGQTAGPVRNTNMNKIKLRFILRFLLNLPGWIRRLPAFQESSTSFRGHPKAAACQSDFFKSPQPGVTKPDAPILIKNNQGYSSVNVLELTLRLNGRHVFAFGESDAKRLAVERTILQC